MSKNTALEREGEKFRREQELENIANLLLCRASYREIAQKLGISLGTVANRVKVLRKRWKERQAQKVDEWQAEEIAQLEAIERAFMSRALSGDPKARELKARLESILLGHQVALPDDLKQKLDQFFAASVGRDVKAADVILAIKQRKSKILGLDAPRRKEITGKGGGPVEMRLVDMSDRELIEELKRTGAWDDMTEEARARFIAEAGLSGEETK